jgi:hypothetical protein
MFAVAGSSASGVAAPTSSAIRRRAARAVRRFGRSPRIQLGRAYARWRAGTVAVFPGANYFLRERQMLPLSLFRDAGVAIAIASN